MLFVERIAVGDDVEIGAWRQGLALRGAVPAVVDFFGLEEAPAHLVENQHLKVGDFHRCMNQKFVVQPVAVGSESSRYEQFAVKYVDSHINSRVHFVHRLYVGVDLRVLFRINGDDGIVGTDAPMNAGGIFNVKV